MMKRCVAAALLFAALCFTSCETTRQADALGRPVPKTRDLTIHQPYGAIALRAPSGWYVMHQPPDTPDLYSFSRRGVTYEEPTLLIALLKDLHVRTSTPDSALVATELRRWRVKWNDANTGYQQVDRVTISSGRTVPVYLFVGSADMPWLVSLIPQDGYVIRVEMSSHHTYVDEMFRVRSAFNSLVASARPLMPSSSNQAVQRTTGRSALQLRAASNLSQQPRALSPAVADLVPR